MFSLQRYFSHIHIPKVCDTKININNLNKKYPNRKVKSAAEPSMFPPGMLPISIFTMRYLCRTCLQELPGSTSKQHSESSRNLQCDGDLVKSLHMTTGIEVNINDDYPKQLCLSCYEKILTFEEFRETALCCAFALRELILEENFSENTQNNLQYFCSTCLTQMQTLGNTSMPVKNREVQRWIGECNELKNRTGVDHWPNGICECCREKLDRFLEFQSIAKSSLMQLDKILHEKRDNKQDKALIDGKDDSNNPNGKSEVSQNSATLLKSSEDVVKKEASDGLVDNAINVLVESKESMDGLPEEAAISHNDNAETKEITAIISENALKKSIIDSAFSVMDIIPTHKSLKIPSEIKVKNKGCKKFTANPTKEKINSLDTVIDDINNEKIVILNQTKSRENCKLIESDKSAAESLTSIDSTIIEDVGLERQHIKPSATSSPVLKNKTRDPKPHKHLQHLKNYSFDHDEFIAGSSHQPNLLIGFPCNICLKVFKRKAHLNRHRRYSTVCARI